MGRRLRSEGDPAEGLRRQQEAERERQAAEWQREWQASLEPLPGGEPGVLSPLITGEEEPGEVWREVPSLEGEVEASDQGRIRYGRLGGTARREPGTLLPQTRNRLRGRPAYYNVRLRLCGRGWVTVPAHVLVAEAFLGPKPESPVPGQRVEVNHKDGDKGNSAKDNLEYRTQAGNAHHASQTGLLQGRGGGSRGRKLRSAR